MSALLWVIDWRTGAAVFGDRLETGRNVEQSQLDTFQQVFNRFLGTQGKLRSRSIAAPKLQLGYMHLAMN
jgi:hypothetical protein